MSFLRAGLSSGERRNPQVVVDKTRRQLKPGYHCQRQQAAAVVVVAIRVCLFVISSAAAAHFVPASNGRRHFWRAFSSSSVDFSFAFFFASALLVLPFFQKQQQQVIVDFGEQQERASFSPIGCACGEAKSAARKWRPSKGGSRRKKGQRWPESRFCCSSRVELGAGAIQFDSRPPSKSSRGRQ